MADGHLLPFRVVPQPDRRQRPDRRAAWRGGRRTSDVGVIADTLTGAVPEPDWTSDGEDDEEPRVSSTKAYVH